MPDSVPMIRLSDVQQTAVHWLWYPYIPFGKLTILQGNPGEGKTYFAMYLTAACTNRQQLPNGELLDPFNDGGGRSRRYRQAPLNRSRRRP